LGRGARAHSLFRNPSPNRPSSSTTPKASFRTSVSSSSVSSQVGASGSSSGGKGGRGGDGGAAAAAAAAATAAAAAAPTIPGGMAPLGAPPEPKQELHEGHCQGDAVGGGGGGQAFDYADAEEDTEGEADITAG
jgi:hypothetical protein